MAAKVFFKFLLFILAVQIVSAKTEGQGSLGSKCVSDPGSIQEQCNSSKSLLCLDGKCSCPFPEHQYFDYSLDACASRAGGPCLIPQKNTAFPCTKNAKCVESTITSSFHVCKCKAGFVESFDQQCDLVFGRSCGGKADTEMCDRVGKVYCIEGKCSCIDDLHIYDEKAKRCVPSVGAKCFRGAYNCTDTPGVVCHHGELRDWSYGVCKCKSGKWTGTACK